MATSRELQKRALKIIKLLCIETKNMVPPASVTLIQEYGRDPFLVLIACLLSLRTKDIISLPASRRLFSYAKTPQELLNRAAWLSKKAEGQLPPLFSKLYSLPFTVEPVPDAIAPNYTGGRAVAGNRKANRAGIYWVNTYNLPSRTLYTLPALTLHEAVPGHHLQLKLT